jgi:hypothetical protein
MRFLTTQMEVQDETAFLQHHDSNNLIKGPVCQYYVFLLTESSMRRGGGAVIINQYSNSRQASNMTTTCEILNLSTEHEKFLNLNTARAWY